MCIYYCNIRPSLLDQPNENESPLAGISCKRIWIKPDYFHQVPWIILWQINEDIEKNLSSRFCVILLTDRPTDKQTLKPNRLGRGNESSQATHPGAVVIILHSGSWQPPHKLTLKSEALSVVLMDLSRAVLTFPLLHGVLPLVQCFLRNLRRWLEKEKTAYKARRCDKSDANFSSKVK